ncbi:MAG: ABC transporter ATP-binding protein [Candidatus Devosia euplotis]|nr:ABC transporter ATP-binding protein [Candidatus Devosia euplotis]
MSLLTAENIVAGYGVAERILKGAGLHVDDGEIVTIIGPNGAGKSTLLKVVAGLVRAREGSIALEGHDVTSGDAVARTQAGISFVPQERNIFASLSVSENLEISAYQHPAGATTTSRAAEMYERYPMLADKRRSLARTLSGGQRQILAMAIGLMTEPKLLLDEPTDGLSPRAADELFDAILALNATGLPVLMIEQHAVEALAVSTRGYVLVAGENSAEGSGPDLAADPEIRRLFLGG